MAAASSVVDSIKAELRALVRQKEDLEREIDERMARLTAPGQPGMDEALVDREGFPRADIDVHAVRTDRNRVICATNDHKALMGRIERLMHELHAAARETGGAPNGVASSNGAGSNGGGAAATAAPAPEPQQQQQQQQPETSLRPFAVVDEVTPDSPAEAAGVQLGDQLCRFADVALGPAGGEPLARVAAALQANEGRPVEAVFLRRGAPLTLSLTPRRWAGRGLLGCHLRPLGRAGV